MNKTTLSFPERIRQGDLLIGTIINIYSAEITEILANTGFDWLFIDAEHGAFDPHDAQALLQAAGNCPCLIRVPAHDDVWLKKALDIGPAGVIVPQVNSVEQAVKIISSCKYPPTGTRGVGLARAHSYGLKINEYIKDANTHTAVVLQAEHRDAAENIGDIIKVTGVDAVLIGPYDLSASFGKPGQLTDPQVLAAIDKITQTCLAGGMTLGIFGAGADDVNPAIEKGFKLIAVGVDSLHLINGARQTLAAIHA